jgi:two-component system LytT family response regulator
MTLRTLVVDDEAPARERLIRLLGEHADVQCVGEADNGITALQKIDELAPDLVFLDIQMPEMNGLEVARSMIARTAPAVIFATAYDIHALAAFDLAAVDYLLKPLARDRLATALIRVRKQRFGPADLAQAVLSKMAIPPTRMAVRSGAKYVVFDTERIVAVVAQDHYATLYVDGRELLTEEPLDKIMSRLDEQKFLRVHRSAIVNTSLVQELEQEGDRKYVARLAGLPGTRIPISRDKLDTLKAKLGIR